jgi:broad specificity phosphatase PhoE
VAGFYGGSIWCRNITGMIYLLRHGHAGNKQAWSGPDGRRPLSAAGRREAAGLLVQLRDRPVDAILSSPALRCRQTVRPLAEPRRLPVALDQRLDVDAAFEQAAALLFTPGLGDAVLCTHGELIGDVLRRLREAGAPIGPDARWPKGSTWLLRVDGDRVADAAYLPPVPASG